MPVTALVRDLMFSSRITAEGRAAGVAVQVVRDPAKLQAVQGSLLLVDLNLDGALQAASHWQATTGGRVVGFVSHVDAETIAAARAVGIEPMPRSRFVQQLPELLRGV